MPLIDADIYNVPDQENVVSSNQRISLKGKTRVYFILFISLHVRVSFPLNHIFRSHHNYSIESWSIIMNQMLNFIAFWAYIRQNDTMWLEIPIINLIRIKERSDTPKTTNKMWIYASIWNLRKSSPWTQLPERVVCRPSGPWSADPAYRHQGPGLEITKTIVKDRMQQRTPHVGGQRASRWR